MKLSSLSTVEDNSNLSHMYYIYVDKSHTHTHYDFVLVRRYREFVNLRARLEKTSQFTKILKSIKAPKWWQQLSLTSFKPAEVEKRRRQLELFLMQVLYTVSFVKEKGSIRF